MKWKNRVARVAFPTDKCRVVLNMTKTVIFEMRMSVGEALGSEEKSFAVS